MLEDDRESEDQEDAEEDGEEEKVKYPPLTDTQMLRAVDLIKGIFILNEKEELLKAETPPIPYANNNGEADNE